MQPKTIYLHIGLPKSGTTYLQNLMDRNRQALARGGLCYPGSMRDQIAAGREVQGLSGAPTGALAKLVAQVDASDASTGVISMETLVRATAQQAEQAVRACAQHLDVRVLVTARALDRSVPAQWQETTQFRNTWSYADYLAGVTAEEPYRTSEGRNFWHQHDLPAIVSRWASLVGPDHVTVVALPRPGASSDTLWRRFAEAVGVDPGGYAEPPRRNESLGSASAQLMLRVNAALAESKLAPSEYSRVCRQLLAKRVLAGRSAQEDRLTLPAGLLPWARECSQQMLARLREMDVRAVGDLDDLVPDVVPGAGDSPGTPREPTDSEVLEAAVDGIAGLVRAEVQTQRRRGPRSQGPRSPHDGLPAWLAGPVTTATNLARRVRRSSRAGR